MDVGNNVRRCARGYMFEEVVKGMLKGVLDSLSEDERRRRRRLHSPSVAALSLLSTAAAATAAVSGRIVTT